MQHDPNQPKPDNHMVWAILTTVLCCIPTGIVSIIYASKVNEAYFRGEYANAVNASKNARMWALIGAGISLFFWLIYALFFGAAIFASLSGV